MKLKKRQTHSPAPKMEQPHVAGQGGGEANRQGFGRKGSGSPCGPNAGHAAAVCPCSKGSQLHAAWSRSSRLRDERVYLEHSVHFWTLQCINKQDWDQRRPQRWWGVGAGDVRGEVDYWICSVWRRKSFRKGIHKRADGFRLLCGTQRWAVDTSWNMGNSN